MINQHLRARILSLWVIVSLFAAFNVLTSVVPSLVAAGLIGIVNTALLVSFALLHGATSYGVKGIAVFLAVCLIVGNIFETISILTGFPFGHYHYTAVLGPKLFLVPITIGGAYFGAGYLSWSVAIVLLDRMNRQFDTYARWAVPAVASFLMVSWDFMLDPGASTIDHYWIWEHGGGFFGVPFTNYMGWLLTVFIFFSIFSVYAKRNAAGAVVISPSLATAFWAQPIVMYALLGLHYLLTYLVPSDNISFLDASRHVWMLHDINETAALATLFTIFAFSLIAALRLADARAGRNGPS